MTLLQPYHCFHVQHLLHVSMLLRSYSHFQCLNLVFDVSFFTSLHYLTVRRTYRSLDQFCEPVDASSDALSSSIFDLRRVSCWVTRDNMYLLCNVYFCDVYFFSFPPRTASIHAQQVYAFACDDRFIIESSCNFELQLWYVHMCTKSARGIAYTV